MVYCACNTQMTGVPLHSWNCSYIETNFLHGPVYGVEGLLVYIAGSTFILMWQLEISDIIYINYRHYIYHIVHLYFWICSSISQWWYTTDKKSPHQMQPDTSFISLAFGVKCESCTLVCHGWRWCEIFWYFYITWAGMAGSSCIQLYPETSVDFGLVYQQSPAALVAGMFSVQCWLHYDYFILIVLVPSYPCRWSARVDIFLTNLIYQIWSRYLYNHLSL